MKQMITSAKQRCADGEISQDQCDAFVARMQEFLLSHLLEDPVWEKPVRPVSKPRAHIRGAYKKYAE